MSRFHSTRISFVLRPTSSRWADSVTPKVHSRPQMSNTPQMLNKPSTNILLSQTATKNMTKNGKILKVSLIFLGVLTLLTTLAMIGISAYRFIIINNMTTTTTTTSTSATTTTSTSATTTTTTSLAAQCYSYTTITDITRLTTAGSGTASDATYFSQGTTWVRFYGIGGTQIPTTSPGMSQCGTTFSGWYASALPSPSNTVIGTVCYAYSIYSCYISNLIAVSNCGSYYVYGLSPPTAAYGPARYCTV